MDSAQDDKEFSKTFHKSDFNYTSINFGDIKPVKPKNEKDKKGKNQELGMIFLDVPRFYSDITPDAFNKYINDINRLLQHTLRNKSTMLSKDVHH